MLKALLTAVLSSGLVISAATPTGAAPPLTQKRTGQSVNLETTSLRCTPEVGGQRCSDIALLVDDDSVTLRLTTYFRSDQGEFTTISSEEGFSLGGPTLVVTDALNATLPPTTLTLEAFSCTPEDCGVRSTRPVTVSASASSAGPVTVRRENSRTREGKCTSQLRFETREGPVAGTITIDGVSHDETGFAATTSSRFVSRCK